MEKWREMFTESGKGCLVKCILCTEDRRTTHVGQGYKFLLKENDQNTHGEGICWSFNFESAVCKIILEAEIGSNAGFRTLMKRILNVLGKMIGLYSRRANNDNLKCGLTYLLECMIQSKIEMSSSSDKIVNASLMNLRCAERKENSKKVVIYHNNFKVRVESMEQVNRKKMEKAECYCIFVNLEVNRSGMDLVIMLTEGERRVLSREILSTEDEGVSHFGLGYDIMKINNNQKVQREEICWRLLFVSFTRESNLEAGVCADFGIIILGEDYQIKMFNMDSEKMLRMVEFVWENLICLTHVEEEENVKMLTIGNDKFSIEVKSLERINQKIVKGSGYCSVADNLNVNMSGENLVEMFTEGGRRVLSHEFLSTEDEGVSHLGLGYNIKKTNNNQKVQGEGICWSILFVSIMGKGNLEAGFLYGFWYK
jgi:hypothetical protein